MLAAGLAGCDAGSKDTQPLNLPPVHVTSVLAATGLVNGAFDYHALSPGDSVLSTTAFKIQVDRLLLPSTVNRQAVCLQPMFGNVVQPGDCSAPGAISLLHPSYDPVRREVTYYQMLGDPDDLGQDRFRCSV